MRFFGGLSLEEIAKVLNVSSRTVLRDWKQAGRCIESDLERIHRQLFPFRRLRARETHLLTARRRCGLFFDLDRAMLGKVRCSRDSSKRRVDRCASYVRPFLTPNCCLL
jgi:hypothetical protein